VKKSERETLVAGKVGAGQGRSLRGGGKRPRCSEGRNGENESVAGKLHRQPCERRKLITDLNKEECAAERGATGEEEGWRGRELGGDPAGYEGGRRGRRGDG